MSVSQQKPEALQNYFKQQAAKEDNSSHPRTVRNYMILRDGGHPCSVEISENMLRAGQEQGDLQAQLHTEALGGLRPRNPGASEAEILLPVASPSAGSAGRAATWSGVHCTPTR